MLCIFMFFFNLYLKCRFIQLFLFYYSSGLVGAAAGYIARAFFANGELRRTKDAVEGQLRRAESRSREILVEAKEGALQIKSESHILLHIQLMLLRM